MRVLGIDFTSAPCARKPLMAALCRLEGRRLGIDALCTFESMDCFRNLLGCDGPWVAGMDFPFGLPRDFVRPLPWPEEWCGYVGEASRLKRSEFRELARRAAAQRPQGARYALRAADRVAGAASPMNVTRPPVGLMFHAGAPTLLDSGATVVPVHAGDPQRVVVEAYPRLVAHALIGRRPYKDEAKAAPGDARTQARAALLDALASDALERHYGVVLDGLQAYAQDLRADTSGDGVDAVMCAVQAAWAWARREQGFGVPSDADRREGWIADPATAAA